MNRAKRGTVLSAAKNLLEMEPIARRRIPNFVFEYIFGGSDDEVSLGHNRNVFNKYAFTPRTLVDVSQVDIGTRVLGRDLAMPVGIGPTGFNGLITKDGDLKLARAAAGAGIPFALSTVSTASLEDISRVPGLWHWMQVYFLRDRDFVRALLERCQAAGYDTIAVTTDSAIYGNREWDARNFSRPLVLNWRNKFDVLRKPRWMLDVLVPDGLPTFKNLGDLLPPEGMSVNGAAAVLGRQHMPSLNWDDVRWLRDHWKGNLILKGLLSVEESVQAVQAGVNGIVLSNHGGRQLDGSVSPIDILHDVRQATGPDLTIILDSGFRRGTDILKALILGANMVLLGRATLFALGAGGQAGVVRALDLLKTDLHRTMGLLGCARIQDLDASLLKNIQLT